MKPVPTALLLVVLGVAITARASAAVSPSESVVEASTSPADAILGAWASPERESVVEVTKTEHGYGGVVVSAKSSALVGKQLFRGLAYDASHGTWSGEVFAPKRGEFLPATFSARADGSLSMTAGKGLVSKTILWTRA
jgi:uncharacterized protein (DUF2147 family)